MTTSKISQSNRILILVAAGFEESPVVYCLEHMREAGLPVSLVGVPTGLIKGLHGLIVRPDCSLDQLAAGAICLGVIVPGGHQCVSSLLTDPRVYRLLETTLQNGGFVAAMATAAPFLTRAEIPGLSAAARFIEQGDMEVSEFVDHLISFIYRDNRLKI